MAREMTFWAELFLAALVAFLSFFSVLFLVSAWRAFAAPTAEYNKTKQQHESGWKTPFLGDVNTHIDGSRDFRVNAGLHVRKKLGKRQWVMQGKVSKEAVAMLHERRSRSL